MEKWRICYTKQYNRRAARFLRAHPELEATYRKTLLLLEANPQHPSLQLHALRGRLAGLHAVSINVSYRITLELILHEHDIVPVNIGDHDAVYR